MKVRDKLRGKEEEKRRRKGEEWHMIANVCLDNAPVEIIKRDGGLETNRYLPTSARPAFPLPLPLLCSPLKTGFNAMS